MSSRKIFYPVEPIGACFPDARLAQAWTPYQCIGMIFDPAVGLLEGTIYPELVRPYEPHPHIPDEIVQRRMLGL